MTPREHASWTEAICRAPADDVPRLVYADWLEERDGEGDADRAAFIRCQIELANLIGDGTRCPVCDWRFSDSGCEPENCSFRPESPHGEYLGWKRRQTEFHALRKRERELFHLLPFGVLGIRTHESGGPFDGLRVTRQEYDDCALPIKGLLRRGFVAEVTLTAEDWQRHHEALYWHPGQTVECPECKGNRHDGGHPYDRGVVGWCLKCWDAKTQQSSGRVARPFAPTCQPLTDVHLTTWPSPHVAGRVARWEWPDAGGWGYCKGAEEIFTSDRFPGLRFHLPTDDAPEPNDALRRLMRGT